MQSLNATSRETHHYTFRTHNYFWFDPYTLEFAGFHLVDGEYQPLSANSQGHLFSQQLNLYLGIHERKLRLFTTEGELLPSPEEIAQRGMKRATQKTQRADREAQRADRLAAKLRELNIDPDTI